MGRESRGGVCSLTRRRLVLRQPAARLKPSTGFLTMEQTRKLLLLAESDPKVTAVLPRAWESGRAGARSGVRVGGETRTCTREKGR